MKLYVGQLFKTSYGSRIRRIVCLDPFVYVYNYYENYNGQKQCNWTKNNIMPLNRFLKLIEDKEIIEIN